MENIEICCSHNVGIDGKDFTPECDCSCHQPTEEKWKEEFDKKFLFKSTSYGDPAVEYVNQANIIQDTTELKSFIENLLEQEREKSSDAKFHFTNGVLEERKRMSDEIEKLYPPKFVNGYTTQDAKTFWEGKLQSYDEVLSIINK